MLFLHVPYIRYHYFAMPPEPTDYFGMVLFGWLVLSLLVFISVFIIPTTNEKFVKPNKPNLREFRRTLQAIHRQDKLNATLANNQRLIEQAAEAIKSAAEANGVPVSSIIPIVEYLASVAVSKTKKK